MARMTENSTAPNLASRLSLRKTPFLILPLPCSFVPARAVGLTAPGRRLGPCQTPHEKTKAAVDADPPRPVFSVIRTSLELVRPLARACMSPFEGLLARASGGLLPRDTHPWPSQGPLPSDRLSPRMRAFRAHSGGYRPGFAPGSLVHPHGQRVCGKPKAMRPQRDTLPFVGQSTSSVGVADWRCNMFELFISTGNRQAIVITACVIVITYNML